TLSLLEDFETVALSRYGAGTGPQADVLRAGVAAARMEADIERLSALRRGAESKLNAVVNQSADTPLPSPELPNLPADLPSLAALTEWAFETRPALQGMELAAERATSNRRLAEKAIWPDLTVGLHYALGRMEGDPTNMGGASVGFSVPLYAGKRQRKLREEATVLESLAAVRLEEARTLVNASINQTLAELDRARNLLRLYREDILPQARAGVESSLASYRVGALDFMALVDAQMAVNRFDGEYFDLLADYGSAVAQLEQTIGRDLPVSGDFILEIQ
ncbi:MAG: TolC family protein, partial [Gemmatimonadetes bacterium]|nr:TolC family protein [Gemmatimonadota bacterium]